MPLIRGRVRTVWLLLVGTSFLAGCGKYTAHHHEFSAAEIEVAPGISLSVSASGLWTSNSDGSETSGPSYAIAVRVHGAGEALTLSDVTLVNETGSFEVKVQQWQPAVRDDAGSILLLDRSGVVLSRSSMTVTGVLRVAEGDTVQEYPFSGSLEYSYRREERSRFWDAINSV